MTPLVYDPDSKTDPKALALKKLGEIKSDLRAISDDLGRIKTEILVTNPGLREIKIQYDALDEGMQVRCSWEELTDRLTENNGHYLKLIRGLKNGGILFGIDYSGNPLFADAGDEPVMTDMDYPATRDAVYFKMEGDKKVETGYEMFSYENKSWKGAEIEMYEGTTGKPIIGVAGKKRFFLWLESSKNPEFPRALTYHSKYHLTYIFRDLPEFRSPLRGVRRFVRVKRDPGACTRNIAQVRKNVSTVALPS